MSGRPRTTSFAEGNKQAQQNLVLGGVKTSSKYNIFTNIIFDIINHNRFSYIQVDFS